MPHLSELHGASTHLAVVAIPVFAILHFLRRSGRGGEAVAGAEPWALAASLAGVAAAGVTGLLVWGQAQTSLRGSHFDQGSLHFWLGILVAVLTVAVAVDWYISRKRSGPRHRPVVVPVLAVLIVAGVAVQGFIGGRLTYDRAVGVYDGGELAQTAVGAEQLNIAITQGKNEVLAGREAFSKEGLGCATCHGNLAQGDRGPRLAGGRDVEEFRNVHGHGLFPKQVGHRPRLRGDQRVPADARATGPRWRRRRGLTRPARRLGGDGQGVAGTARPRRSRRRCRRRSSRAARCRIRRRRRRRSARRRRGRSRRACRRAGARDSCARRKYSGASCSHVAPMPPCTAMFVRAA